MTFNPRVDATGDADVGLGATLVAAMWTLSLAVGLAGWWVPDASTAAPASSNPTPVLEVELSNAPAAPDDAPAPPPSAAAAEAPDAAQADLSPGAPPELPSAPAIAIDAAPPPSRAVVAAAPSHAIAFAVPVPDAVAARSAGPPINAPAAPASPRIKRITYGRGEGAQPSPQYPSEAAADRQQGTVVVRFTVNAGGRVTDAEAVSPCVWPLLNDAAVRAVRDTWRFAPGDVRIYEVPIVFQLRPI